MVSSLKELKKIGIKKVELVCPFDCECCKNLQNKVLPIDMAQELPFPGCAYNKCLGRYAPIIEFDLS